ncbi:MAG: endonuclease/exonuclease/phosphatase family protein [Bacteroidota bacterium]
MRFALCLALGLGLTGCSFSYVLPDDDPVRPSTVDPVRAATALLPGYAYPAGDTVRVATYNLEHFVDAFDSPYIRNRREDAPDADALRQRHALFVDALRELDADVVSLQEVEGEGLIRALVDSLAPEMGYRFVASADDADWYMNVVVLSRLPLGPLTTFADAATPIPGFTDDEGRSEATDLANHRLLAVDVYARPGYTFTLVAAHLKAGRGDRDEAWRTGQAGLMHAWLGQRFPEPSEANVLLAGDLNAIPGSPSFAALLNANGAMGPVRLTDPLADRGSDAWTHPSDAPTRQLDHVLPSAGAQPEVVRAEVPRPTGAPERLSDHLPVVVTLLARDR